MPIGDGGGGCNLLPEMVTKDHKRSGMGVLRGWWDQGKHDTPVHFCRQNGNEDKL